MNNPVVAAKFEVDLTRYLDPTGKLIANAGGVICASVEYRGGTRRAASDYIDERIRANVRAVLEESRRSKALPRAAAVALAERRVRAAMTTRRWR